MGILNYSTKISVSKTIGEISEILGKAGATSISTQYEKNIPSALFFCIEVSGAPINFKLPANWLGVAKCIREDQSIPRAFKNDDDQARRTAWRIIKDWVEAQMALIESGQAELAEVFLPYAVMNTGRTLFQKFTTNTQLLLS